MSVRSRQLRRPKSLTEQAADEIRQRIVFGDIALGSSLSENMLAAELGVSKTPVREALLQLKNEGLVSIQPQRGSFVFDLSASEIVHLGDLRETLELAALRLAAKCDARGLVGDLGAILDKMTRALDRNDAATYRKLDAEFHRAMFERSANKYLLAAYLGIAFRIQALRTRLSTNPVLNRSSFEEHAKLCKLVDTGRAEEAAALLSSHVRGTTENYAASIDAHRTKAS
ncbi:GntR family transcriptional regulator [Bradyrhizobium sp. LHD-71]|uniref:GntR family transcriptional regulator n=1 Tax=Bradyrhizobium sp. LHD-71 TaxID=3072141 RepID=UPI00280EF60C|nr:GntR family transcriptional regulator [Bradyrhizobium sp. LHD-71]MDQ8729571.1 GntR family transcriptional regulator [Bradyrhizobium sp. LHD-71]